MMDIKKTIGSTTVKGSKDSQGRDFRTQLNVALDEVCSQAGFDVQKDPDGTNVTATLSNMAVKDTVGRDVPNILIPLYFSYAATGTLKGLALPFYFFMSLVRTPAGTIVTDGVTDFYSCGNCIYVREEEK